MNRFRDLLSRGMELGAGSDSPITTIDPLVGVAAFEATDPSQRLGGGGRAGVHARERPARASGGQEGSLEPGKHADFAVYDVDPIDSPSLDGVRPVLTVSLGRDVYAA